jgi:nitroimidazol reductase NimA-like FMN-containing flavoprotein (pyridoxamine 5'-phosphate oxidase superfamily)
VWVRDTFYFHVAPTSQTGRNLARNPAVVVHLPSGDDVVIIKGTVERVRNDILGPVLAAEVATASRKQYPEAFLCAETWHYQPHEGESFAVRPSIVYAWTNLAIDPTRWDWATGS